MEPEIVVYRPGTPVRIGDGQIEATVLAASIWAHGVEYKVASWSGNDRHDAWVAEVATKAMPVPIGFKPC